MIEENGERNVIIRNGDSEVPILVSYMICTCFFLSSSCSLLPPSLLPSLLLLLT